MCVSSQCRDYFACTKINKAQIKIDKNKKTNENH